MRGCGERPFRGSGRPRKKSVRPLREASITCPTAAGPPIRFRSSLRGICTSCRIPRICDFCTRPSARVLRRAPSSSFIQVQVGALPLALSGQNLKYTFPMHSDQLMRLLCEYSFVAVPYTKKVVTTPTGNSFQGVSFSSICGVSIMRSGEAMEAALRSVILDVKIGKVLVQRDVETKSR
jgi:hypothetical protein